MREFRIKVNDEKTYVVKANDYNQAVKTLHSKLRDFDDTKKNINVVREFITNNGGKFSKSKDADAILDFIYKKTGVKNADYGDVLYIIRNYTNVKVEDNAVSDSISRYTGEDAIRTNGFVKIKEDGDWTSYKYTGNNFDDAVFKIHQYNPSLIAFVSNGNRTITVRNKYLNDADNTAQGEIEVLKSFGFDYKDGKWVKESNNNDIIVQPDYHYVSVIGPGDTEKHCKKYQYQSAGMLKKIIASNIKDSSITDADMKIAEDIIKKYGGNPVGNVMGLQKTRFVGQDEIKNQHDFATDLDKAGYKFYLINGRYRISPKDSSIKDDLTMVEKYKKSIIYIDDNGYYYHTPIGGRGAKAQRDNTKDINIVKKRIDNDYSFLYDSSIKDVDWDFANKLKQHSQEEIRNALKYSAPTVYKQYRNGETIQFAGLAGQLTGPEKTKVLKRLGDSNILSGYKYRITNNGSKWYYETTFPDGHTTLTGPYSSKQETEQYFHKHRPTEKLTDANRYNKGQKFQTSAGIHEIIGYDPVKADANTNRIEYSYRIKTPNGTYTNMPDWQLEELVKLGRYKLIDSDIKDSDSYQVWTINEKGVYHKEADVPNPQLAKAIASQLKKQGRWVQISKNSRTNIVSDCNMMDSLSIKVKLNGKTYKGVFNGISNTDKTLGDVYIPELVSLHSGDKGVFNEDEGRYVSDGKFYFKLDNLKKWNPSLSNYLTDSNITDADPVKVEKIIRKEKSALGITYYIFQTKSSSGYTIYYQVTDKTYHGEPTYSGGGIISLSLKSANDTLDHNLLADKLKAKYGEKEGTKRYLRGENDSAIKDKLSTSDANSLVEAYIDKYKYTHSNLPYVNKPKIKIFNSLEEFRDKFLSSYRGYSIYAGGLLNYNGYVVKLFTSAKDGKIESPSADNIFTIFPTTAIKDSNNIKNRKSYTIKVGDKQYKVFAESESEAINKYIKSKKQ